MEKTRKQKFQQETKTSLKTIFNLQPELVQFLKNLPVKNQNLINRLYPNIHKLKILRIFTLIEINFIIFSFLQIINKTNAIKVQHLKIGIIGGGIMGRLIINTLLVFTKQGLKAQNILVSTRQPQHLQFYQQNFGIKAFFDNQKISKQCDLIFVATPATLDNWIIADLINHVNNRPYFNLNLQSNRNSYSSTGIVHNSQFIRKSISSMPSIDNTKRGETEVISVNNIIKKEFMPIKNEPITINPFIYILTSDFTEQKSQKLFNFPVMTPCLRVSQLNQVIQKLQSKLENYQAQNPSQDNKNLIKLFELIFCECLDRKNDDKQNTQSGKSEYLTRNQKDKLIQVLDFSCKKLENYWKRENTDSKSKNQIDSPETYKFYNQILNSKGSFQENFLKMSRKYRMAYNNFVA